MVVVYASANRDEAVFGDDPDRFDPDRPSSTSTWPSARASTSAWAPASSRLEGRIALQPSWPPRIDSFSLADTNDFEVFPSFMLRGLKRLDLEIVAPA